MSSIHRLWQKPSLLTANLFYRVASCRVSVLQLLENCLLCCEVWNMILKRTSMWQGRVSNCDGSCGADITVLFPSEVIKIFCNNICESVRFMVWDGFSLLKGVRITGSLRHQSHLTTWLGGSLWTLSCWSAELCVTWYARLLPNFALSLSL